MTESSLWLLTFQEWDFKWVSPPPGNILHESLHGFKPNSDRLFDQNSINYTSVSAMSRFPGDSLSFVRTGVFRKYRGDDQTSRMNITFTICHNVSITAGRADGISI